MNFGTKNFKTMTALACAGIMLAGVATPLVAQDMLMGDDAIAERKQLMKSNGGTMRSAGGMSGADAVKVGETLVANFTMLKDLWPADSQTGDTKAKSEIWNADGTVSDGYELALTGSLAAAQAVLVAANAGDTAAYGAALKALGGTCGQCHGSYRNR